MSVRLFGRRCFSSIDTERLYHYLKSFDYISFDIFDTLVKRDVPTPLSVFELVELFYCQEASQNLDGFAEARYNAEIQARACSSGKEVTIDDIYQKLPYDTKTKNILQKLELQAEYMVCTVNRPIIDVYTRLLEDRKKVYLVSDMYLPQSAIISILKKCNIYGYRALYLSSEYGVQKRNGLFDILVRNEKIKNQQLVHVGDNWRADHIPLMLNRGYRTCKIPYQIINTRFLSSHRADTSFSQQISDCFINNHIDCSWSYFKQVGFSVFGPLLISFIQWIKTQVQDEGINKIFFLERDGYVLRKAWKLLYEKTKDNEEYSVFLSRVSILPVRLKGDYSVSNILKTIPRRQNSTVAMVLKRVNLYTEDNIALAKSLGIDLNMLVGDQLSEESNLYGYLKEAMKSLPQLYAEEAARFESYMLQFIKAGDRVAIVDVGWNGTAQKAISLALSNRGIHADLYGYYLGMNKRGLGRETDINAKGYLVDEDSSLIDRTNMKACMGFIEFFLTAPYGMTVGYRESDMLVEPVLGKYEYMNSNGTLRKEVAHIGDLQEGALQYIDYFNRSGLAQWIKLLPNESMIGLKKLCVHPDRIDLRTWGNTYNFENSLVPFANPKTLTHYIKNITDFRKDFGDATWKIGFLRRLLRNMPAPYFQVFMFLLKVFHK